ncbi:MAG: L,D-transpeptidase family protein [Sphingomonadaceae bacterium]|jgi:L,D-peptidoglycan transpeptidase YkuD (ErfK/YbiS/YcfS/YnhG family)
MSIAVRVDTTAHTLTFKDITIPCSIGKGGACAADAKREGDGCTPLGIWPIRGALIRRGRVNLQRAPLIPWRWTRDNDGWSDGVDDPAYNRPVLLPHRYSHERLQREDAAYDIVIVLGHNDAPPVRGMGSAIFWHIWVPGEGGSPKPTEGCVGIAREKMDSILPMLEPGMAMEIF